MSEKSGSAIKYESMELYHRIRTMIEKHRKENDEWPKYLFLSDEAYYLFNDYPLKIGERLTVFMGIEIIVVDISSVYASLGGRF